MEYINSELFKDRDADDCETPGTGSLSSLAGVCAIPVKDFKDVTEMADVCSKVVDGVSQLPGPRFGSLASVRA